MDRRRVAVFLDRDGTLMEDVAYCARAEDVRVFAGVAEALGSLRAAGFLLVLATNQSGIGRGLFTAAEHDLVEQEFERQLGVMLDGVYVCPDAPGQASECRKPGIGMISRAVRDLGIDLEGSYLVGDKASDVVCGQRAGVRTVLVLTGRGAEERGECEADFVAEDMRVATAWILGSRQPGC